MKKPFTVYLDTNFFVWLRMADEASAGDVINSLNSLGVRHVLSDVLSRELLANRDRPDFDRVLFERVSRFSLTPYCTNPYLTWEELLSSSPDRPFLSDILKGLDAMATEAHSHALTASRIAQGRLSTEQIREVEESTKPFLEQMGITLDPESPDKSLRSAQLFVERLVNTLREVTPEGTISGKLEWSQDPFEDASMLINLLDPKDVEATREADRIKESIISSEDRAYQVAAGIADSSTKRNLAHTLRDSEHMSTFVRYKNDIDALQVDKAQMNLILRSKPIHRLVELGLSERCFTAGSLQDVVRVIERMISE